MRPLLGEAGYGRASGPRPVPAGASPKAKNPRRVGGQSHPISAGSIPKKTENYLSAFSGELHCAVFLDR
jgi:hypothetical protein